MNRIVDKTFKLLTGNPYHYLIIGDKEYIEIFRNLPKEYFEELSPSVIEKTWKFIPKHLKDEELKNSLPCYEHYNTPNQQVHIDGPPPDKKHCRTCRAIRKLNRENEYKAKYEAYKDNNQDDYQDDEITNIKKFLNDRKQTEFEMDAKQDPREYQSKMQKFLHKFYSTK